MCVKRMGSFSEEERIWRLPALLYVGDLLLLVESEENMRLMIKYDKEGF